MAVEISGQRPVGDWIALIKEANSAFDNRLGHICGDKEELKRDIGLICWEKEIEKAVYKEILDVIDNMPEVKDD